MGIGRGGRGSFGHIVRRIFLEIIMLATNSPKSSAVIRVVVRPMFSPLRKFPNTSRRARKQDCPDSRYAFDQIDDSQFFALGLHRTAVINGAALKFSIGSFLQAHTWFEMQHHI